MTHLEQLVATLEASNSQLRIDTEGLAAVSSESSQGIFYTPLIALTMLLVAAAQQTPTTTTALADLALNTLVQHLGSSRFSGSHIRWSVTHKSRCADALVFLENISLLKISQESNRRTAIVTPKARTFIRKLTERQDDSGLLARQISRTSFHTQRASQGDL